MIFKFVAAIVLLVFGATFCLAADKPAVTDDVIHDNVMIKLASDQVVKGGALVVDVKQGVVTISGQVENIKQKERATKLTKQVKGVRQVVNNINLKDAK